MSTPTRFRGVQAPTLRRWMTTKNETFSLLQNAVKNVEIEKLIKNTSVIETDPIYSHDLVKEWKVTNQKSSGRCWLFASLNVLRVLFMKKMNVKNFEFSQSYMAFYDKLERANYFLEIMIETKNDDIDDRTIQYCITQVASDGGQHDMFKNLVKKYGVVPKQVFGETASSGKTIWMRRHLKLILLDGGRLLRGCDEKKVESVKLKVMTKVYRLLLLHYGTPPEKFSFSIRDKNKKIIREKNITPLEFTEKYVDVKFLDECVSLIHDPRKENPFGNIYSVKYLGNVWGVPVKYLNVEMDVMKQMVVKSVVEKNEPVFFGCDFGKNTEKSSGTMHENVFLIEEIYDTKIGMSKEDRLKYGWSQMTHAMVIVGVDVDEVKDEDGKVVSREILLMKVENSHGVKRGKEGFLSMTPKWFEEYNYQVVVPKKLLPDDLQKVVEKGEIKSIYPAWDPMGSLAD